MRLVAVWWCYRIVQMAFLVITVMSAAFSERLSFGEENQTRVSCSAALTSRQVEPPSLSKWFWAAGSVPWMDFCVTETTKTSSVSLSLSDSAKATPSLEAHMVFFSLNSSIVFLLILGGRPRSHVVRVTEWPCGLSDRTETCRKTAGDDFRVVFWSRALSVSWVA